MTALPRVVLVHGGWADDSSWSPVFERLPAVGQTVTAPQFSLHPSRTMRPGYGWCSRDKAAPRSLATIPMAGRL
jgi:hypothetical protein